MFQNNSVSLEQKFKAFQAYFNINSDTIGIYKDGTRDYIAKQGLIAKTIQGSIGRVAITDYDAYVDRTLLKFIAYSLQLLF